MKGIVYLILNDNICKGYVGSTIHLKKRMKHHKSKYNECSSKEILLNPYSVEILEELEFELDEELLKVEQKWLDHYRPYLVNKNDAYITNDEKQRRNKARYLSNRDKYIATSKAEYIANRDYYIARAKELYYAKRQEILAQQKIYQRLNKDKINARQRAKRAAKKLSTTTPIF